MNKKMAVILAFVAVAALMAGCTKTNPTIFTWDYVGQHYIADSSSAINASDNKILAHAQETILAIDPAGKLAVGTYVLHAPNSIGLPSLVYYYINSEYSQSGALNITYVDATKFSGTFSVTYQDGTYMSGAFTDIPIK